MMNHSNKRWKELQSKKSLKLYYFSFKIQKNEKAKFNINKPHHREIHKTQNKCEFIKIRLIIKKNIERYRYVGFNY